MFFSSKSSLQKLNFKFVTTFVCLITFYFLSTSSAFAVNYSTVSNGSWTTGSVWKNQLAAPLDLHKKDSVEIIHVINAGEIKVTNGGTLTVFNQLNAQKIILSGTQSKIIVEPGATLNSQLIEGADGTNIVYKSNNPLPVTLVFFGLKNSNQNRESNTLVWATASELNNDYFSIEKSTDGKIFTEAGRVAGKNPVGGASYTFEDKNVAGRTYYRLKQVDFDDKTTYSAIITASLTQKLAVNGRQVVFSNAFNGKLNLLNGAGQNVKAIQLTEAASYELPENFKGIYILQIESAGQVTSQRIML